MVGGGQGTLDVEALAEFEGNFKWGLLNSLACPSDRIFPPGHSILVCLYVLEAYRRFIAAVYIGKMTDGSVFSYLRWSLVGRQPPLTKAERPSTNLGVAHSTCLVDRREWCGPAVNEAVVQGKLIGGNK